MDIIQRINTALAHIPSSVTILDINIPTISAVAIVGALALIVWQLLCRRPPYQIPTLAQTLDELGRLPAAGGRQRPSVVGNPELAGGRQLWAGGRARPARLSQIWRWTRQRRQLREASRCRRREQDRKGARQARGRARRRPGATPTGWRHRANRQHRALGERAARGAGEQAVCGHSVRQGGRPAMAARQPERCARRA